MIRLRWPRFLRLAEGKVGAVLLIALVFLALIGPLIAPHSPIVPIGSPGQPPSSAAPLGTDFLGRDILSRILHGGISVLLLSSAASLLVYLAGGMIGLVAGYSGTALDAVLMRAVDVVLSIPGLLLLILVITGVGSSDWALICGVVLVLAPGVARIVRTATLEVAQRDYTKAALARGEKTGSIIWREILPNIVSPIMADLGTRFGAAVILIASVSYLGLGVQPPTADWAVMVSENRQTVYSNIYSVLIPCLLLGLLTITVSLIADAYARTSGSRGVSR